MKAAIPLRTGSVGVLEIEERCVVCDSGAGEDVEHLLVTEWRICEQWWGLVDEVNRIVCAGKWQEEYRECKEGKVALLLGQAWEGHSDG